MIEGRGLFFSTDIAAGMVVIELGGRLVSTGELETLIAEADADPQAPSVDTITNHPDQHLVLPPGTPAHFGNHSCDPTLLAHRPVLVGDEARRRCR